jgi:hypothetical protein
MHVTGLLSESACKGEEGYLADVLLGALVSELVLFQRRQLSIAQAELKRCWRELIGALVPSDD